MSTTEVIAQQQGKSHKVNKQAGCRVLQWDVRVPKRFQKRTFVSQCKRGYLMINRVQRINSNGEVVFEMTTAVRSDMITDDGYLFPAHKAGARMFTDIHFPLKMSDSDIGKMTRLSKFMIGDTNALGYRSGKKIFPYSESKICEMVGINTVKRGKQFIKRMVDFRMIKKKDIDKETYYVVNPAYFIAAGKRLTCSLFLEFQEELTPLLPNSALVYFSRQAKEMEGG